MNYIKKCERGMRQKVLENLKTTINALELNTKSSSSSRVTQSLRRLAGGADCSSCPAPCCMPAAPGIVMACTTPKPKATPPPLPYPKCAPIPYPYNPTQCCIPPPCCGRVRRVKSRELRAGTLIMGCACEKKNGIQDQCPRYECSLTGNDCCLPRPARCPPSKFAGGKHLENPGIPERENQICYPAYVQAPCECSPC